VLYKDKLLVTASAESEALVALDCKTGKEVWRETAGGFAGMWGTPVLVNAEGEGAAELVMSVPYEVWSFDPDTGKLLWYCEASQAEQAHASAVTDGKVVYAFSGRGGGAVAVRVGGKDDVTQSNVAWKSNQTSSFGSPILYNGKIYLVTSEVITTFDAATGVEVGAKLRLRNQTGEVAPDQPAGRGGRGGGGFGSADYASPIIADGKLYYVKGSGETFVIELGEELKQLSTNKVTAESESFGGTPAISDGQLFLRSNKHLYCIGE
jgi:outer membrane protein assembly factor BamB